MGASSSKSARSAASAVSRRQYPRQPITPSTRPNPPTERASDRTDSTRTPHPPSHTGTGPTYHSQEPPSDVKSAAIDLDGRDPDFAASLRSLGPVTPTPTLSNSSTFNRHHQTGFQNKSSRDPNRAAAAAAAAGGPSSASPSSFVFPAEQAQQPMNPALLVVTTRQKLAKAAELEAETFGRQSHGGREFLDALTIRQALVMRDRQGLPNGEIEKLLRLKKGVVERLGRKGVVSEIGS